MRAPGFSAAIVLLTVVATYFGLTGAQLPVPQYLPLDHSWAWTVPPGGIGMDWYARTAAAFAAGGLAYPLAQALARRGLADRPRTTSLLLGVAFGLLFWAVVYIAMALIATPRQRHPDGSGGDHAHE